jgi:hypothetical protein
VVLLESPTLQSARTSSNAQKERTGVVVTDDLAERPPKSLLLSHRLPTGGRGRRRRRERVRAVPEAGKAGEARVWPKHFKGQSRHRPWSAAKSGHVAGLAKRRERSVGQIQAPLGIESFDPF